MKTKNIIQISTVLAIIGMSVDPVSAASKPEAAAQKSAEQWLSLVDADKFAESWKTAATIFQAAVSREQWKRSLATVRKPLGGLISRELKSAKYTKSVPGAPAGEYVILQFDTSFANKKEAVETVTPTLDKDGQWKVSGYHIK
jgi:hypothetical protein